MEVPDWGFESLSRYEYVQLPKKNISDKFWHPTLSFQAQSTLIYPLCGLGFFGYWMILIEVKILI